MTPTSLKEILQDVQRGTLSIEEALSRFTHFPSEMLPHACLDNQRYLRTGIPEVIYGAGKTSEQIIDIAASMLRGVGPIIATRVTPDKAANVLARLPAFHFVEDADMLIARPNSVTPSQYHGETMVISAGTSDLKVAEEARHTLMSLGHPVDKFYDAGVAGLHRLLSQLHRLQRAKVIIVVAGMEGALPSVIAGLVRCPVIAVPTSVGYGASFGGIAALLGMLNSCAPGIAVVNIDNGFGAACMAEAINRKTDSATQKL